MKLPWKNPHCPKCKIGHTKQIKFLVVTQRGWGYSDGMEYGRALFKCKHCGHEFEGFGHRRLKREP